MQTFTVSVAYIGEGEHDPSEETFEDVAEVAAQADGRLAIRRSNGSSANLSAGSWGAFKVVKLASAGNRV